MKKDIEDKLNVMRKQVEEMEELFEEMRKKRIQLDTQKGFLDSIKVFFN